MTEEFDDELEDDELPERGATLNRVAPIGPAPGALTPAPGIAKPSAPSSLPPLTLRGISPATEAKTANDQAEQSRLEATGSGISQIEHGSKPGGIGIAKPHPVAGGILRGLNTVGSIAGAIVPGVHGVLSAIPGTEEHHQQLIGRQRGVIGEDLGEETAEAGLGEKEAQTGETAARTEQAEAAAEKDRAAVAAAGQPKPKEEKWTTVAGVTDPQGRVLQQEENSGQMRWAPEISGTQPLKEPNDKVLSDEQQAFQAYLKTGMSPTDAFRKVQQDKQEGIAAGKPDKPATEAGTWTLQEDPQGNSVLMNSKTGETKPATGVVPKGTGAKKQADYEKNIAGPTTDLNYAQDYIKNKVFTGPGDEALMEKFFDLAKPSSGFRMTQPQITMLNTARSWMQGMEAHLLHATKGTWFTEEQRQQIASTMQELANLKLAAAKGGPQASAEGAGGNAKASQGGKQWNPIKGQYE